MKPDIDINMSSPPLPSFPRQILLRSDGFSPNGCTSPPLPALLWPGLFSDSLSTLDGIESVKDRLMRRGWEPQWVFPMYKEAHFHSTTHELLTIIRGSARLLLGGRDEVATDLLLLEGGGPATPASESWSILSVSKGDVLLLPAGYSHRALSDQERFTMIGSYPLGGKKWDMCYPDQDRIKVVTGAIERLITSTHRKGLGDARDPSDEGILQGWDL